MNILVLLKQTFDGEEAIKLKESFGGVDLSEAKIVVSGGRGVKSAGGFKPLQELAAVLGGALAPPGEHAMPAIAIMESSGICLMWCRF